MKKINKGVIFKVGVYIIIFEIVYIISSIFIESYYGELNAPYESWMAREWGGVFNIFILFLAVVLAILLGIVVAIKNSYEWKPKTSKLVSAVIIILFTMLISYFPIGANTSSIIRNIKRVNNRESIPDYEYCLDCRLGFGATTSFMGRPMNYKLSRNLKIYGVDTNIIYKNTLIDKLYGIKDINDSIIIAAKYTLIRNLENGLSLTAIIRNGSIYYGYIDTNANIIFPNVLDYGDWDFSKGSAKIVKNHKFGIIDSKGNILITPIYNCIKEYRNGLALFYQGPKEGCFANGEFGLVNGNNDTLVKPSKMNKISFLSDNVYMVQDNSSSSIKLYNFKGELLRDKKDIYCSEFFNGKAYLLNDSLEYRAMLIDTNANILFKSQCSDEDRLYELYVKNQIIRNYQIIEYDSLKRSYEFLNKPIKRQIPLNEFSYDEISKLEDTYVLSNSYYVRRHRHRKDYVAYEAYFKSLRLYCNHDSAQIDISNDSLKFRLIYYLKNDSLIFFEND